MTSPSCKFHCFSSRLPLLHNLLLEPDNSIHNCLTSKFGFAGLQPLALNFNSNSCTQTVSILLPTADRRTTNSY